MATNCIILDDEPLALDLIEDYVKRTPFLNLCAKCSSPMEALEVVRKQKIELAFLDIQMPLINGLELSKMLEGCAIIFTTAFSQYAIEGYKVNAVGYLLKPFSYAEFMEAANKGCKWCEMRQKAEGGTTQSENEVVPAAAADRSIMVRSGYIQKVIKLSTVLYVESIGDYVKFHLDTNESIKTQMSLKSAEEMLPKEDFFRVHRSFIVNIHKVKIIERSRIIFGHERIPISDSYREAFNQAFSCHFTSAS